MLKLLEAALQLSSTLQRQPQLQGTLEGSPCMLSRWLLELLLHITTMRMAHELGSSSENLARLQAHQQAMHEHLLLGHLHVRLPPHLEQVYGKQGIHTSGESGTTLRG